MPKPIVALCVAVSAIMVSFAVPAIFPVVPQGTFHTGNETKQNLAIICPPPVTVSVPSNTCTVFVNIPPPASNDPNCPIVLLSNDLTGTSDPSGNFTPRIFTLAWTVEDDCGSMMTCNQVISVTDNTAPVLVCPQNIVLSCSISEAAPYNSLQSFLAAGGQSSDNCTLDSISFTLVSQQIVPQPIPLPITIYSRVYRIRDIHTNEATCMQSLTVGDLIPPVITCPPDVTTGNSDDGRNTTVIVDMPVTSDNCAVESFINDYNDTPDASDFYPVGTTLVNWTVTDTSGNTATCQMSVIVFDNTPPDIFCPDEELYQCLDELPLPYPDYLAFEAAGGDATDETALDTTSFSLVDEFSDDLSCPETITRVYVISDEAGNTSTCSQEFIVNDQTRPVIQTPDVLPDLSCNQTLPVPQTLLVTDNCGNFEIEGTVLPFTPNICNGYVVTHQWTATDDCGNQANPVSVSFFVQPDLLGPVITQPADITVNTDNNLCVANVTVPPLSVSDNCSQFSITNNITNTSNASGVYPLGTTQIRWTVTDACGNVSTSNQHVTVIDNQGPNLICKANLVIALNDFINDEVPATHFIESVTDNCNGTIEVTGRRTTPSCGTAGTPPFGPLVPFCCDDVPVSGIMVEIKATDERNRTTTCMVAVDVQDNIPPIIHDPLPDITISCEYPLNLNDLSAFGTFVAEGQPREEIIIPDHFYLPSGFAGLDGVYFDNCPDVMVSVDADVQLTMCNQGTISRNFTLEDAQGNTVEHTQTIYVTDVNPFNQQDIQWPQQEVFLNNCSIVNPNPSVSGRPVLNNDKCSQAAATYTDLTFPNNAYCRVIRRTWTVIDWCRYIPNTQTGRWTFQQFIYISNDVPPVISPGVCDTLYTCTPNGSCTGQLQLSASGTDDCLPVNITWTYKIDEGNNNSIEFTGTGSSFSRSVSRGSHRVIWEAKDGCGNVSSCQKIIHIKECKAPAGIVHHGLAANLSAPMGMAAMNARLFNNGSSDNCTTASKLRFSYSTNTSDTVRTFDCSMLGTLPLQIWVTDLEGNQTIVNTYVVVQDNNNVCNNLQRIIVAGTVRTVDSLPLPETKIMLEGGETYHDQMTNEEGKFCFQNLGMFNDYTVAGERKEEQLRGVSTLDLVLIQRHILEIEKLDNPYSLLAADVDASGKINTLDLVSLRKLILGTVDTFPDNRPWIFVKENQTYIDPENPWMENLAFQFENMDTSRQNTDFTGVKAGDVNHSYSQDLLSSLTERRTAGQAEFHVEDVVLPKDKVASVSFRAKNYRNLVAQQFTLELNGDVEYAGFEAVDLPLTTEQIAQVKKNGKTYITCAFHATDPVDTEDGNILFNLLFRAKTDTRAGKTVSLNHDITPSMVYSSDYERKPVAMFFTSQRKPETALIKQNIPNPFKEETTLEFILTARSPVQYTIYDGAGKMVYKGTAEGNPGLNSLSIGQKELGNARGVLFVKMKSDELNEVVRMLRIE